MNRSGQWAVLGLSLLLVAGCATASPRAVRSEFDDVLVPKGLKLDLSKSTIIESPTVKSARLFYKGRLESQSLAAAFRATLEANGWRHISSTTLAKQGTTQVYEKNGDSLQVRIWEGWYYTWAEVTATRVVTVPSPARRY
ncbi:MAG: hypothetical protein ACE5JN_07390 [Candidatus Methylomirabilia bacterium]